MTLSSNDICQNIMVKHPYNILKDLKKGDDGSFSATTKNEYLADDEAGPISAAEAGRHLAILGSVVLSQSSEEPKYYLALSAHVIRKTTSVVYSDNLTLTSKVVSLDRKKGQTSGEIYDDNGDIVFSIIVDYQIISTAIFEKLFKKGFNSTSTDAFPSPYIERRHLTDFTFGDKQANAVYGEIAPQDCIGHFMNYPALPVAIVCNLFSEVAFKMFHNKTNNKYDKLKVNYAKISARRLVFSGEHITFQSKVLKHETEDKMIVYCEAFVDGKVVADTESEIQGIL